MRRTKWFSGGKINDTRGFFSSKKLTEYIYKTTLVAASFFDILKGFRLLRSQYPFGQMRKMWNFGFCSEMNWKLP